VKVRYSANAKAELAAIFAYIARENPKAADAVVRRIESVVSRLAVFPGTSHPSDTPAVFVAPLVRYPYSIYFKVENDELIILHIHHTARQPPTLNDQPRMFVY
jgi:plasmid stabilization system protein ParE